MIISVNEVLSKDASFVGRALHLQPLTRDFKSRFPYKKSVIKEVLLVT